MTKKTLVLIERMFLTPESVFVLQFGMALPAAVFVAIVLIAPESSFVAQAGITNEAQLLGLAMGGACRAIDLRLTSRHKRVTRDVVSGLSFS
jgi:hypothetical protein